MKVQIFNLARNESLNFSATGFDVRNQAVISIFKGLIASDGSKRFHRNYGELSYALGRSRPPNLEGAIENISTAIQVRDRLGIKYWKYYEFRRARYRIQKDPDYLAGTKSSIAVVGEVKKDLKVAIRDDKWQTWLSDSDSQGHITAWMALNVITEAELRAS